MIRINILRCFDVMLSLSGLTFASPVLILLFLVLLWESPRPLFCQKRLGLRQSQFVLIKFRTMRMGSRSVASHLIGRNAVTPIGRWLRRTKLDELPQLWNVLKGDMSLVGPRPGLPNQLELTMAREKAGVFLVKPGITGLSQICGVDMSTPELLAKTDARMILTMSLFTYFKYLILTILGKGNGDCINSL